MTGEEKLKITSIIYRRQSAGHRRKSASPSYLFALALAASTFAAADVKVKEPWVRGTVPAQTATGAFMTITSSEEAKLVGAASPAAKTVEIHNSEMHGSVMHMQAVDAVPLPAGKAVQLKPGGFHVMMIGLDKPVKAGDKVPLKLTIEDAKGKRTTVDVTAEVRPLGK
jgi:copper(I)-binding protein